MILYLLRGSVDMYSIIHGVYVVNVVNVVKDRCIELGGETYQRLSSDVCLVSLPVTVSMRTSCLFHHIYHIYHIYHIHHMLPHLIVFYRRWKHPDITTIHILLPYQVL